MSDVPPPSETASPASSPPPPSTPKLPPPNAPKPPPRQATRAPVAVWLGAILIVALGLVGSAPYWAPPLLPLLPWSERPAQPAPPAQEQTAKQLAIIQQQLEQLLALSNRVAALENRPQPDAATAIAPVAAQVQQLGARLDQIDKQLAQLARDEAANAESPRRVLMIALASLGNAIASSRPFAAELASVEALGQNRKDWAATLRPLEAAAKAGIPSTAVLAQRFSNQIAPAILRADAAAPSSQQGLGQAMLARLRGLVVIRRVDGSGTGTGPTDQAVAQAQAALDKGDLAGAVKALGALSGAAANAAQPWMKDAQQRLDAEQTIAKLSQDLAGDMAAGSSGG
jgi:hypothetical protein